MEVDVNASFYVGDTDRLEKSKESRQDSIAEPGQVIPEFMCSGKELRQE
jgi:hypothetical protein